VNGDPSLEGGNVDLLDGQDQASATGGNQAEPLVALQALASAARQNRRLFGRRDTSLKPGGAETTTAEALTATASTAAATSSFYSFVTATAQSAAVTSPPPTLAGQQQQQHTTMPAVRVEPGTKNLILARALDKESAEGESSQLVNVRCRPRQPASARKQSSYTTIPIRLIITDANDHAPEFVGQLPYVINISETTPVGAIVSRDILAIDKDSAGPHSTLHYRVLDSHEQQPAGQQLAAHFAFTNPLEPILTLTGALDYESLASPSFVLSIAVQDQGEPEPLQSIGQLQVNVLGECCSVVARHGLLLSNH
jgi:hypothetical protein